MKKISVLVPCLVFVFGCENEEAFDAENLVEIITELKVEDNNQPADGVHSIKVLTVFPDDFETEDNGKVTYTIFRDTIETQESDITTTLVDGKEVRLSELVLTSKEPDTITIRSTINVANKSVFKETEVQFRKALPDSINLKSSVLTLSPNDFSEIDLTLELLRNVGAVSANAFAQTIVIDTLGNERGLFNNYTVLSNAEGKIENKYTLGNDDYVGPLIAISRSRDEFNNIMTDTVTLISKLKEE